MKDIERKCGNQAKGEAKRMSNFKWGQDFDEFI